MGRTLLFNVIEVLKIRASRVLVYSVLVFVVVPGFGVGRIQFPTKSFRYTVVLLIEAPNITFLSTHGLTVLLAFLHNCLLNLPQNKSPFKLSQH